MNLQTLTNFITVADQRSISRAAVIRGIAQPALSRQILQLEQSLGCALFHRRRQGVELTPAGRQFLDDARRLLRDFDDAKARLHWDPDNPRGEIRIAAIPSIGSLFLTRALLDLRQRYPGVEVALLQGFSATIATWLEARHVDLALTYADPQLGARMQPFVEDELTLVSAPQSSPGPCFAATLRSLPLVLPQKSNALRDLVDRVLGARGVGEADLMEVDALDVIKQLVRTGRWHALLPLSAVAVERSAHDLVTAAIDPPIVRRLVLASPPESPKQQLRAIVAARLRRLAVELSGELGWRCILDAQED